MSSNARRKHQPDAHQTERRIAENPATAWEGRVRISAERGTWDIPGTWHLQLPEQARTLRPAGRTSLPLPAAGDMAAWRDHLVQLVTLRVPGMQMRVRSADSTGWRTLEFAAPTAPASVAHVDREAFGALLGQGARMEMRIGERR